MVHRADNNQREIVEALRAMGASVLILSQVGGGACDLLVGWRGKNHLLEVKSPTGELSKSQVTFFDTWRGRAYVVRSVMEAIELVNEL